MANPNKDRTKALNAKIKKAFLDTEGASTPATVQAFATKGIFYTLLALYLDTPNANSLEND